MKKDLPIFTIHIDEDADMLVDVVSIVEFPAHESNFLAFSKHKENDLIKYKFASEDKRQLLGAAVIPNQLIYRRDGDDEGYVVFTEQEVEIICKAFMKRGFNSNMNVEHSKKDAHSFIYQSFITSDIISTPAILGDLPLGTWVVGVQVEDEDLWKDIKAGKRNGFSIEGLFNLVQIDKEIITEIITEIMIEDAEDDDHDEEDVSVLLKKIQAYSAYLTREK